MTNRVAKIRPGTRAPTTHPYAVGELVLDAVPEDERLWVPMVEGVWFRPLMFNTTQGGWCHLIRVRKAGVVSRHRHPDPVHGLVLKGAWRYLDTIGWQPKAPIFSSHRAKPIPWWSMKTCLR